MKEALDNKIYTGHRFDNSLLDSLIANEFTVTIKNYAEFNGLSSRIHEGKSVPYFVKGPMGKGLDLHHSGTHIAFVAGTGVLTFIDLVAHLIRKNLNLLRANERAMLSEEGFKFILCTSYHSREDAIAF